MPADEERGSGSGDTLPLGLRTGWNALNGLGELIIGCVRAGCESKLVSSLNCATSIARKGQ